MMKRRLMEVSAPGKIIISGEHSVVYEKNAICGAINLKCRCQCWQDQPETDHPAISFVLADLNETVIVPLSQITLINPITYPDYLKLKQPQEPQAQRKELFKYKILTCVRILLETSPNLQPEIQLFLNSSKSYSLVINSEIPIGGGLGSSAAFSTCIAASLLAIISSIQIPIEQHVPNKPLINKISLEYEKIYHAKPSGLDNYISLNGGLVVYNRVSEPTQIDWKMKLRFGVIDSKVKKNTAEAVMKVAKRYSQDGKPIIEEMGELTNSLIERIRECDEESFLTGLKKNHSLLKQLDLSNNEIESIVSKYSVEGSVGKITGAGMGGYVLIVSKEGVGEEEIQWKTICSEGLQIQVIQHLQS